jgi:hypothetical protein
MQKVPRAFISIAFLFFLLLFSTTVLAQSGLTLHLSVPELTQFPKIALYLDIYDQLGGFINDLNLRNFRLFEDGNEQIVNEVMLIQPGLDTIVALNLGPTLSNQGSGGTYFQEIYTALGSWLNSLPASQTSDLYSFVSNEGIQVERQNNRANFILALQSYIPNLYNFKPTLDSLADALDIASKPNPNPHGKQAIFFFTPLLVDSDLGRLPALETKAAQYHVPVFVWLMAADTSANSNTAIALTELANKTGGKFFLYSETASAPDPESYFAPMRSTYRLRYTSSIHTSGTHKISIQVQRGDQQLVTPEVAFNISLQAPVPFLVNLPAQVIRNWAIDDKGNSILSPEFITLQMRVSFPDGYPRQLKVARLFVDGKMMVENTLSPLDFFGWVVNGYTTSGSHTLQVEVEDILGFKVQSLQVSIPINIQPRNSGLLGQILDFLQSGGWLIPVGLVLAGSVYYGYRQRGRVQQFFESLRKKPENENGDPLTQTVIQENISDEVVELTEVSENVGNKSIPSQARLVWFGTKEPPTGRREVSLDQPVITIGQDAQLCTVVLTLDSVEKIHTVISRSPEGQFTIANRSVKSGTWVNYAPVSSHGTLLQVGDLVGIGQAIYRFEIGETSSIANELNEI